MHSRYKGVNVASKLYFATGYRYRQIALYMWAQFIPNNGIALQRFLFQYRDEMTKLDPFLFVCGG